METGSDSLKAASNDYMAAKATPLPVIDAAAVLHLRPEVAEFRRVRIDEPVWSAFLYAREVFRWQIETSMGVLGDAIPAPAREEVA